MVKDRWDLLANDKQYIREELKSHLSRDFSAVVKERMEQLDLSINELADRMDLSRAAVDHWLNLGARPHGKEGYKLLGLALCMDEVELNAFLLGNGYP